MLNLEETKILERLKATGDDETLSVALTLNEWGAIGAILFLALAAGNPAKQTRTAYEKVIAANREYFQDKWEDVIE